MKAGSGSNSEPHTGAFTALRVVLDSQIVAGLTPRRVRSTPPLSGTPRSRICFALFFARLKTTSSVIVVISRFAQ